MENTDKSLFDLSFDENVKQQLKGAATWGGIAAITSLVGSILGLVAYFVQKAKLDRYSSDTFGSSGLRQTAEASGLITQAITLLIAILLFVQLFKFSKKTKLGVDEGDSFLINDGLASLSNYFKFIGVLLIIVIVLFGLGILIGITQNV